MQDSCDLKVRLTPRADRDAVGGVTGGVVAVRVSAPPADGQANASLIKVLAKALGVPKSRLSIVRGQSARDKLVRVDGLRASDAHARLDQV